MRAFTAINSIKLLVLLALFLVPGCAQNSYSVKGDNATSSDMVVLRDITVSGEGNATKLVITADKPLTYTSYSLSEPFRTVIDLSQADPGTVVAPQPGPGSLIKKIDLVNTELSGGSLVRITVETTQEVDFIVAADPSDSTILTLTAPEAAAPVATATDAASQGAGVETEKSVAVESVVENSIKEEVVTPVAQPDVATPAEDVAKAESLPAVSEPTFLGLDVTSSAIVIQTGKAIDKYKYFLLSKPQRLVVDVFDVKNAVTAKSLPVNRFGIDNARIGTYPDKVRIVFDSSKPVFPTFAIDKGDAGLLLSLSEQSPAVKASSVKYEGPASVEAVDFQVLNGISRIAVTIQGDCTAEPAQTANGMVLTLSSCKLPKRLQRPFITSAFPSVVKRITPYQIRSKGKDNTKILVTLRESTPYTLKKEGSVYLLDITNPAQAIAPENAAADGAPQIASAAMVAVPASKVVKPISTKKQAMQEYLPEKEFGKKVYTGKRVTLEFADADIRKIFQLIAEVSNLNFLVGDDVSGTISIKLVNVPWDQALDVILETKGLGMKQEGNIVMIRPKGKIMSLADEELAARRAYERTLDLRTKIFDINFASVGDIATQFNSFRSERGTISVDSRTNRVIVNDVEPAIEKMANLLKALDIPEKQVLIEARIVEASSSFTQDLGIQWGIHYRDGSASMLGINSLDTGFGGIITNEAPTSGLQAASAAGGALGLSFGKLTSNVQVDLRLSAAAETGQVKIISTPKVVTLNNKSAKISQGQMIPYSTVSAEGTKTEFVEAALTLEVTPHITADGSVSMKIKASNNSAGSAATGIAPPINKKEATTELLVKSGETTVIGGIYVDSDTSTDSGVPFLMDIPLLGWLFKSNNQKKSKSELLIFITPKIVS